jgi:hypothetical protein
MQKTETVDLMKRLSAALRESCAQLDEAYRLIKRIPLEPQSQNCVYLGEAIGLIIQVQKDVSDSFLKRLESGDGDAALELAKIHFACDIETEKTQYYLNLAFQLGILCETSQEEAKVLYDKLNQQVQ